jgi:alcohol dehydrogenase
MQGARLRLDAAMAHLGLATNRMQQGHARQAEPQPAGQLHRSEHILKGDVPETTPGTILGHEAVGTVQEVGAGVSTVKPGDRVLLSCVTSCGSCRYCKEGRYGQCLGGGGWIFGHLINGLQAEYARVPFAEHSVYKVPGQLNDEQVLFLADILPTSFEVGVLNGMVSPGDTVAIVGAGPIGLAAILTARLYTPGRIVAIDLADSRLESATRFGADETINNGREDAVARVMELTDGLGADAAFEAVGVPETFELAAELIRPCGRVANIGVHGKSAHLHLEKLWIRDVTITTGPVTAVPSLSAGLDPGGSCEERTDHAQEASACGVSYALGGPAYRRQAGLASVICVTPIRRSVNPASQ